MPEFLAFRLAATMGSFGVAAGNFSRGTEAVPGHSLVVGLIGAALGLEREDERLLSLSDGLRIALAMESRGAPLRDFHTVQSRRERRGPPPRTRKATLEDAEPYTTLSERDYYCDVVVTVAVARQAGPFTLADMCEALLRPRFTLYLGRKSCPLAAPPHPLVIEAERAADALVDYRKRTENLRSMFPIVWRDTLAAIADARLDPANNGRRSRRRTLPGARSTWSYRLLEELTLDARSEKP
ncbi:MAG: type I-E CRISPR-associated protein Cas5/CasD [Beijerinckiaceae bacterium]